MISNRKLSANQRNAFHSTGPRTVGGKLRSRSNALRHGLAIRIDDDPEALQNIERLEQVLAVYNSSFNQHVRTFAECYFDLRRIDAARTAALQKLGQLEAADLSEHAIAAEAIQKINRYAQRVLSRRRNALRAWNKRASKTAASD